MKQTLIALGIALAGLYGGYRLGYSIVRPDRLGFGWDSFRIMSLTMLVGGGLAFAIAKAVMCRRDENRRLGELLEEVPRARVVTERPR